MASITTKPKKTPAQDNSRPNSPFAIGALPAFNLNNSTPPNPAQSLNPSVGNPPNGFAPVAPPTRNPYGSPPPTAILPNIGASRPVSKNGVPDITGTSSSLDAQFNKASESIKSNLTISPDDDHFLNPSMTQLWEHYVQEWKKTVVFPAVDAYLAAREVEVQKMIKSLKEAAEAEIKRLKEQHEKEMEELRKEHEREMAKLAQGLINEAHDKMKGKKVKKTVIVEYEEVAEDEKWNALDGYSGLTKTVKPVRQMKEKVTVA